MSVYRKGKRWVAQVHDPLTGNKRQVGTFDTKRDADAAMRAAASRTTRSLLTVGEWRAEWLANPEWRDSTRRHNAERTARFNAMYGTRRLGDIDRTIARRWIETAPSTHGALSSMFGAALYADNEHGEPLLPFNPFARLVRKRTAKRDLQGEWLTDADVSELEAAAIRVHGPHFGATMAGMIRFAAETGVRPGELFALEHGDLRPEAGRVTVARAVVSRTGTIGPTKNGKARDIVLSDEAMAAVARVPQLEGQRLLFVTAQGRRFAGPILTYHWKPVRSAAGRDGMHFYELRHYCATRLLEAGLDYRDVGVQLGHADGDLVRRVYGHPSDRLALDRVRDALNGGA